MNMIRDLIAMLGDAISREQALATIAYGMLGFGILFGVSGLFCLKAFLFPGDEWNHPEHKTQYRIERLGRGVLGIIIAAGSLWLADVVWLQSKGG